MNKLRNWAIVSVVCATMSVAYRPNVIAQVPIIGSLIQGITGQFGNLVAGCDGCGQTAWSPGSFTKGSWMQWGNNGGSNGETDFINKFPGGTNGGFAWFSQGGSTLAQIMSLTTAGTLTVPQVNGNAATATVAASTTGNAATATALASPTGVCVNVGNAQTYFMYGVTTTGNPGCNLVPFGKSTSVAPTGATAGSTATTSVPLNVTMPDTNYSASCMIVNPTGAPSIQGGTKTTTSISVTIQNGQGSQAVASGGSEIDCTIQGS
jgi:hypothetical protein